MAGDKYSTKGAYEVHTLYFDSAGFGCYDEKKAGLKFRKKIRLRFYEPELKKDTPVYLEIKRKDNNIILKDRLVLSCGSCQKLLSGENVKEIKETLRQAQGKKEKEVLEEFLGLMHYNCLRPKVMVSYSRMGLIDKTDKSFRITFDSEIKAGEANGLFSVSPMKEIIPGWQIMEVKFKNTVPAWYQLIVQKYDLDQKPFSKYCSSVNACQKDFYFLQNNY